MMTPCLIFFFHLLYTQHITHQITIQIQSWTPSFILQLDVYLYLFSFLLKIQVIIQDLHLMIQTVVSKQVQDYYSEPAEVRYDSLLRRFQEKYGSRPDFIARAPGRVNIIGEHIDYEGYGVLPAAIEKDCLIAFKRVKSQTIQIAHSYEQFFPDCTISKYPSKIWQDIPHPYVKYFAAGYRAGVLDLIEEKKIVGLQLIIQGNIPWASGISSSSAFCVCSAMVSHYANRVKQISKEQFVERCIKFERQVGTASGGMDQSISYLGKRNCCLYIQFNPIRAQKVQAPFQGFKLVIMNSLVQSAKMDTAIYRYNKRVCECRIATHLLAKNMGIEKQIYSKWKILKQLQEHLKLSLEQMLPLVDKHLERKSYTKEDLEQKLGVPLLGIIEDIQRSQQVLEANKEFRIFEAAYHVYSEANRVLQFVKVCRSDKEKLQKVKILGELMNKSQQSCRDLYQCSCPQIEKLTTLARKNGALGSRLTGAGWGGCTISIIPQQIQSTFIKTMTEEYYKKPGMKEKAVLGIHNAIFSTETGQGAFVIDLLL